LINLVLTLHQLPVKALGRWVDNFCTFKAGMYASGFG